MELKTGRRHSCDAENVLGGSAQQWNLDQYLQAACSPFLLEQEMCEYLSSDHSNCTGRICDLPVLYVSICGQALILPVVIAFFTILHLSKWKQIEVGLELQKSDYCGLLIKIISSHAWA